MNSQKNFFHIAKWLATAVLVVKLIMSGTFAAGLDGTTPASAFTSLGMARNVTTSGIYYFNLNGTTFSTYVESSNGSGWVIVANQASSVAVELPETSTLTATANGILPAATLALMTGLSDVRILEDTYVDATTTNSLILANIAANKNLAYNQPNTSPWTGSGISHMNLTNLPCNNFALKQNIFDLCAGTGSFVWRPNPVNGASILCYSWPNNGNPCVDSGKLFHLYVRAPLVANTPSLTIQHTSIGGTGSFTYTGTNGWASQTVTTATAGTAVTGNPQAFTTPGTATTITEAIPLGYSMSSAYCTGLNGGTATINPTATATTATISFNTTAMASGNNITCYVTNTASTNTGTTPVTIPAAGTYAYTVPPNVTRVQAKVAGAGGGSGGADVGTSGAGGTGALVNSTLVVSPGQVISGTIGAAGQSGWTSGNNNATGFIYTNPCSGNGAGGGGFSNGAAGGAANCPSGAYTGLGWSGGGGGGGGSSSLSYGGAVLVQAGGGGGGTGIGGTNNGTDGGQSATFANVANCGTIANGSTGGNVTADGGGGGGGGGGYTGGAGGAGMADGGDHSTGFGGAGTSCYSNAAAVVSGAVTIAGGAGAPAQTYTVNDSHPVVSPGAGSNGFVTISPYPLVTLSVTSVGGTGTFAFASDVGGLSQSITTTTAGTAVAGSVYNFSVLASTVKITQTPAASGYVMTAASCTSSAGGTPTYTLASGLITLDAASTALGANITCNVTMTKLPTLTFTMISIGGKTSFTFDPVSGQGNGWTTQSITTVTPGIGVAGAAQTLSAIATATSIKHTIPAGYAYTALSCTANGSAISPTVTPTTGLATITFSTSDTAAGNAIACTVTDTRMPTFALQVNSGPATGGPLHISNVSNLAVQPSDISTTTANMPAPAAPTPSQVWTLATVITVKIDALAGFNINAQSTAACTDSNSAVSLNPASFTASIASNILTVGTANVVAGADITCVWSIGKYPTLKVTETTTGLGGTFTFTGTNGWTSQSIGPTTAGTPLSGASQLLTAVNTSTSLTQGANLAFVLSSASCTDANSANTGKSGSFGTLTGTQIDIPTANIVYGSDIVCAFSNTAANPTLLITKTADKTGPVTVGTVITYTYTVKNTGYVAMTGISVSDSHHGKGTLSAIGSKALANDAAPTGDSTDTHPSAGGLWDTLGPGDTITFKSTYTVTQQDIDLLQ